MSEWNDANAVETRNRAIEVVNGTLGGVPRAGFMVVATDDGDLHTLTWAEPIESVDMTEKEVMSSVLTEAMATLEPVRRAKARLEGPFE